MRAPFSPALHGLLLASACLLAGCETLPQTGADAGAAGAYYGSTKVRPHPATASGRAIFSVFTPQQRNLLDDAFAAVILGACPLLPDAQVQRYVNQVGQWLALQLAPPLDAAGRPVPLHWRFAVIVSDAVSSFATPGGRVFVTAGLLRRLESEAELAAVLAHEMAHVTRGDHLAAMRHGGFTLPAARAAGSVDAAAARRMAVTGAMQSIYVQGLAPQTEFAADRQALRDLVRAGYASAGLPEVLRLYAAAPAHDAAFQLLRQTHPDAAERLRRLGPALQGLQAMAIGPGANNAGRFAAVRARVR